MSFPRVPWPRRGYATDAVDRFCRSVEENLDGDRAPVDPSLIRRAGFPLVRGGYSVDAVDTALDHYEEQAARRAGPRQPDRAAVDRLLDQLSEPRRALPRAARRVRGYRVGDVDACCREAAAAVADVRQGRPPRLDAQAVRTRIFRPRRGGYDEEAVDELFDRVVDVLLADRLARR